jgi:hypothetical protein
VAPAAAHPQAAPEDEPIGIVPLCRGLITSPRHTLEYDVPHYVRSHRAVRNIALFYVVCITPGIVATAIEAAVSTSREGGALLAAASVPAAIIIQAVGSVLGLIAWSAAIALVNLVLGRSEGLLADTGALALRFALVGGTTQLVGFSTGLLVMLGGLIAPPLAAAFGIIVLATFIWTICLFVLAVMVTYDYGCLGAVLAILAAGLLTVMLVGLIVRAILGLAAGIL